MNRAGHQNKNWRWVWLAAVVLLLGGLANGRLLAHGGGTLQVDAAPVGPYELSVWTLPDPFQAGEAAHVTIYLFDPSIGDATDGIVLDADVIVTFRPATEDAIPITVSATHENATLKYLYEADAELATPGDWEITIDASAPKGNGRIQLTLPVVPAGGPNWTLIGGAAIGLVALLWIGWQSRQQ